MNKFLITVAIILALGGTSAAYATPGGEGNNTGCNGQGNPNSPCEPSNGNGGSGGNGGDATATAIQGQSQGQLQGQVSNNENSNTNTAGAISGATSGSTSDSNSSSNSGGNSMGVLVGVQAGGATSGSDSSATGGSADATGGSADATGGAAYATSGDSTSNVGDTTSNSGGNTQQLDAHYADGDVEVEVADGDNSQNVTFGQTYEDSSASAATVFAGWCQSGASAQMQSGGFSVVNPEQFCNNIRMAAVALEAYEYEMSQCKCVGVCTSEVALVELTCDTTEADKYLAMYHENLDDAHNLLQTTEVAGKVDAFAGYLIRPLAILALLILL